MSLLGQKILFKTGYILEHGRTTESACVMNSFRDHDDQRQANHESVASIVVRWATSFLSRIAHLYCATHEFRSNQSNHHLHATTQAKQTNKRVWKGRKGTAQTLARAQLFTPTQLPLSDRSPHKKETKKYAKSALNFTHTVVNLCFGVP